MIEALSYGFMQKAVLAGIMIAISCSLLGVFLVLARLSLLGDALAHVAFAGIAIGLLLGVTPLLAALAISAAAALLVLRLSTHEISGDSATALVLSLGVGTAVIIIGAVRGFTVDLFSYLFGSILAISRTDLAIICAVTLACVLFIAATYRKLMHISFNIDLARLSGVRVAMLTSIFAVLVALTTVMSIRAVGVFLVSALLVLPALIALTLATSFRMTLLSAAGIGVAGVTLGIIIAFYANLPPGGTIAVLLGLSYLGVLGWKRIASSARMAHK